MPTSVTTNPPGNRIHRLNTPENLIYRLNSPEREINLKALRKLKNQIIGNRTRKLSYVKLGAIPAVSAALASAVDCGDSGRIIEACAVIGSFSCGLDSGVKAVIDAGAVDFLFRLVEYDDAKVVDAVARSLKMIYQSQCAPKYNFHLKGNMAFIFSLLKSDSENLTGLGATIITHSCQTIAEQEALCEAGILKNLINLLRGSLKQRDAGLQSLASVIKNNPDVSSKFVEAGDGRALRAVCELIKDKCSRTRLLASMCLIAMWNSSPCQLQDVGLRTKLIHILLELLDDPGQVGDEAPFALSSLIEGKESLQKIAFEADIVDTISQHLKKDSLHPKRMQGLFLARADACSKLEACRSKFISLELLKLVAEALTHDDRDVRIAASVCLRSVSRSIKSLSAGLFMNEAVVIPLIQLLNDVSTAVQIQSPSVQEQALCFTWNFVECIEHVFVDDANILHAVGRQLQNATNFKGMYVLTNVATGNELHKDAVLHQLLPLADSNEPVLMKFLRSTDDKLRTVSIWTVINLTFPSSPGAYSRLVKLRSAGVYSQIKEMANDSCLDVKLCARTALGQQMSFGDNCNYSFFNPEALKQ